MSVRKSIVVWRSLLLPASETFIRHQGDALLRWEPTYIGALKADSALAADTDRVTYPDGARGRAAFLLLRATGRSSRLRRVLAAARPCLIHAHFGGDAWLISRTARRAGVPLVITLHGRDVTQQANARGPRGLRYRWNLRTAFGRATVILAVSEAIRARAISLGADPAKVRVHHTGVPIPSLPAPTAKTWDVVFVGRFVDKKGVDDLIEALALTGGGRPRALFIGDGPLWEPARRQAAELGLDATFMGVQPPAVVRECVAASKILVAPSRTAGDGDSEGLPTVILEASSLGVPTVSTYHSGIPEAVLDGQTGLLCRERDRPALAAAIDRLLADDELRLRLGHAARRHVESEFDLTVQTRRLEELYDAVISGAGRPSPRVPVL
jgi:colanic acid/amylovoran biosynthesis glycosyltransferase